MNVNYAVELSKTPWIAETDALLRAIEVLAVRGLRSHTKQSESIEMIRCINAELMSRGIDLELD